MHLLIATQGSRGDVQPYVALGSALRKAGATVTIGTHKAFEWLIAENQLGFVEAGGDVLAQINTPRAKEWVESGNNPIKFVTGFRDLMGPELHHCTQQTLEAATSLKVDAIIGSGTGFYSALSVAEKLRLPYVHAFLQPIHPNTLYPSPLCPIGGSLGPAYNFATYMVCGQMFWQSVRPIFNDIRKTVLGLPPVHPLFGPMLMMHQSRQLVVYGFSPSVIRRAPNWPEWVKVTGYWFLDAGSWQPPADLVQFLAEGPPPICVGFGSMSDSDPQRMTDTVIGALRRTKQRGLLLSGWGGLHHDAQHPDIFVLDQAPHAWLFPRCAAVVHHCGAGTTAAVLRSGVPGIPVPFFADQPFWAQRAFELGVAAPPINRRHLDVDTLSASIARASEQGLRERADALGAAIRAEHGAENAARIIAEHLGFAGSVPQTV